MILLDLDCILDAEAAASLEAIGTADVTDAEHDRSRAAAIPDG